MGSAAGVGERAVFSGPVVFDFVAADQLFTDRDLNMTINDRDLYLATFVRAPGPVILAGETNIARRINLARH